VIDVNAHREQMRALLEQAALMMREAGSKGFIMAWLTDDGKLGFAYNVQRLTWAEQVGISEILKSKMIEATGE
jgi:hypothetical protein